jgi:hypothetical protein
MCTASQDSGKPMPCVTPGGKQGAQGPAENARLDDANSGPGKGSGSRHQSLADLLGQNILS